MINENCLPDATCLMFEGRWTRRSDQYMVAAYYWLGWGIKGISSTIYAYEYTKKLVLA